MNTPVIHILPCIDGYESQDDGDTVRHCYRGSVFQWNVPKAEPPEQFFACSDCPGKS